MILSSAPDSNPSPAFVEGALTFLFVALAFAFPGIGSQWFRHMERFFGKLARRRGLAVASVGATAFLLRLAILPLCPIPLPFVPDDFSFLLAGDTFAHGRLTNPTPMMWTHFESIHITMTPTYMSMYFPAPGLVLAAGKALTGQPWFGLLTVTALMCAAICWMLQAWLPPGWALIGGAIAIMRIGLFSYWINTYNGGGSVAALGGALVLGAFPRLMRTIRLRDAMLLAIGISILLLSRPFEGLLLCSPVALVLGRWLIFGKNRPTPALAIRRAALPLILIIGAGSWLGYYDYRAFGSPLTLPYTVARATYAVDPYFIWQPQRPVPEYRHQAMRYFYTHSELSDFDAIHTPAGFLVNVSSRLLVAVLFLAGTAFLVPSIMLRRALMDRRIRFLVICCTLMTAGLLIQLFLIPHYLAPYLPALYAIGLQAMRHLRVWAPGKRPVGATLVQLTMTLCIVMAGCRLFAGPLHLALDQWPPAKWLVQWYGPGYFGTKREQMKNLLERLPGKQLVIVRYSPQHNVFDEWVYNDANIDDSNVIWARDMSQADNAALVAFYKDRHPWILDADENPAKLTPFSLPEDAPSIPAHRIQATKLRQQALSFADPGKEPR